MMTLAMLGFDGGKVLSQHLADLNLHFPIPHMGQSEDGHLVMSHILVYGMMENLVRH